MKPRLVFTANNRPAYFAAVSASWSAVRGLGDWDPVVHLEPSAHQHDMSRHAHAIPARVHLNPTRLGVLRNPWRALDAAFGSGADFVVLAEDDILVSDDILEYFTWAATSFASDPVLAVCATNHDSTYPTGWEHQARVAAQFSPLVWGTWATRWYQLLRDTWDHDYSSGTPQAPQCGWDWNINLRVLGGRHIIVPAASRATHIGQHAGTHTTPETFPASTSPTYRPHHEPGTFRLHGQPIERT